AGVVSPAAGERPSDQLQAGHPDTSLPDGSVVAPLSSVQAPPPRAARAEGGPTWSAAEVEERVGVVEARQGGTVLWVRSAGEALDVAAYRAVEHAQVPAGVVGVLVHADHRGAYVDGRWVPGDVLAEVISKRLGVKPGVGAAAPTVVLLSCQAMDD